MFRSVSLIFLLTLWGTNLTAATLDAINVNINGKKYLPTTYQEIGSESGIIFHKRSPFINRNVILLVSLTDCDPLKYSTIEDSEYEPRHFRRGYKRISLRPPQGSIFRSWTGYLPKDLPIVELLTETRRCKKERGRRDVIIKQPKYFAYGTIRQGTHKSGKYGIEVFDIHGLIFADAFGENQLVPDIGTVVSIIDFLWSRGK